MTYFIAIVQLRHLHLVLDMLDVYCCCSAQQTNREKTKAFGIGHNCADSDPRCATSGTLGCVAPTRRHLALRMASSARMVAPATSLIIGERMAFAVAPLGSAGWRVSDRHLSSHSLCSQGRVPAFNLILAFRYLTPVGYGTPACLITRILQYLKLKLRGILNTQSQLTSLVLPSGSHPVYSSPMSAVQP